MNENYERYLKRYCAIHGVSEKEAETHQLVKEVKMYYEQKDDITKIVEWKENDT